MGRVGVTRDDRTVSADAVKNGNASVAPEESRAAVFRLNYGDVTRCGNGKTGEEEEEEVITRSVG